MHKNDMRKETPVSPVVCEKDRTTGKNIYRIQGSSRTVLFDAGDIPEYMMADVDMLIVNNCYPENMRNIRRMISNDPEIILAGTAVTLNFTEEFLGTGIKKHIIRRRETLDLGGLELELLPVPNINRSRHQDRTWRKAYRFLQMPNWQWIDSTAAVVQEPDGKRMLVSGQFFSSREDCSRQEYFMQRIRPFRDHALKTLKMYSNVNADIILPEQGEAMDSEEVIREYEQLLPDPGTAESSKVRNIVIAYVSEFGYTEQLAGKIASGAGSVPDISVRTMDLSNADTASVITAIEKADGVLIGTPTIENDASREVLMLLAQLTVSGASGKMASAFGSYSYGEAGVSNVLDRMGQLGMITEPSGFTVRFRPDENELQEAYRYGMYFAECTAAGEILPMETEEEKAQTVPVQTGRKFIIIGNGAAGVTAAEEIRKRDTGCSIEMISRENTGTYNRQILTKCMLSSIPERNMLLYSDDWYDDRNITVTLGRNVISIDPVNRQIMMDNGENRSYDKLIIASGAEPVRADVPGRELDGIFCIHDLAEADRIRGYIESNEIKEAVVIGGGIMGLETAEDLKRSGMNITIMESGPHLMMKQLDEISADLVAGRLEKQGVRVMPESTVSSFEGSSGKVEKVRLQSEKCLDAQLVIQCMGIRENSGLAESLTHSGSQGIAVNERMETGIPDIYACGDCAVYNGENFGLWPQAVEMALAAARNAADTSGLTGCRTTGAYRQILPSVTFTGFDMSFFAAGDSGKREGILYQTKETYDPQDGKYRKLFFRERQLCGFILYGDVDLTTELIDACAAGTSFDDISL